MTYSGSLPASTDPAGHENTASIEDEHVNEDDEEGRFVEVDVSKNLFPSDRNGDIEDATSNVHLSPASGDVTEAGGEDETSFETEPLLTNNHDSENDTRNNADDMVTLALTPPSSTSSMDYPHGQPPSTTATAAAKEVVAARPPASHIMRSRRTKSSGGSGTDDDDLNSNVNDNSAANGHSNSTTNRFRQACLRRKPSREVTIDPQYLALENNTSDVEGGDSILGGSGPAMGCGKIRRCFRVSSQHYLVRTTVSVMNLLARILLWGSFLAMVVGVVWYSRELKMNGTDPHLIAWFSAGAFVLLGFPISMCGIFMHLTNYYQPNVQCYVVRILWMVPIYSIESWLCLRFHTVAIYIETLRDFYESYVLYSFLQFLIEVLGGEEALVMMLKDKSPTRGVHMAPLNWCVKPWLMGQPVSRRVSYTPDKRDARGGIAVGDIGASATSLMSADASVAASSLGVAMTPLTRPVKRIQWTSPFFVKCKFGVLQYVLLKFVSAIFVMILEIYGLYKEGDFTPRGGYLYICIVTNLSQCWALYCLVFFYYATKNELGPIRPVGKFLSVKAVVFFTWWQSLGISILFQMGMIPHYAAVDDGREWTSEAVAKGLQDYLICIEMFVAAIVHTFVFPHTDYLEPLAGLNHRSDSHHMVRGTRRLGRRGRYRDRRGDDRSSCSKGSLGSDALLDHPSQDVELGNGLLLQHNEGLNSIEGRPETACEQHHQIDVDQDSIGSSNRGQPIGSPRQQRQGFVRALLDSTVPRDVFDETVGIVKGDFHVEKKTLLHHAATSDEYDLFSKSLKWRRKRGAAPGRAKKSKPHSQVPDSISM